MSGLVDGVAAAIGGLIASEFILAWQASGPVFDGLALVPALIGGLLVGIVVEVVTLRHGWPVHPRGDVRLNAGLPGRGGQGPAGSRGPAGPVDSTTFQGARR